MRAAAPSCEVQAGRRGELQTREERVGPKVVNSTSRAALVGWTIGGGGRASGQGWMPFGCVLLAGGGE